VPAARIGPGGARHEGPVRDLEPREPRVRAADVPGEDQPVVYQLRPSCCISASAAAGPHDPAA
jgi:hypothetical protein